MDPATSARGPGRSGAGFICNGHGTGHRRSSTHRPLRVTGSVDGGPHDGRVLGCGADRRGGPPIAVPSMPHGCDHDRDPSTRAYPSTVESACGNCGRDDDDLSPVHRVYLLPEVSTLDEV